jgi:hypothetical protein
MMICHFWAGFGLGRLDTFRHNIARTHFMLLPIIMNFCHISLLLLVVLSAYSSSPQHAKPPDSQNPIKVTNNSSAQLGILAPVLPQNEVFRIVLPHNGVSILPHNEVLKIIIDFVLGFCYMVQTNWALLLGFLWKAFSMFQRCMLSHCLRIKLLLNSDADLLSDF